AFFFLTPGKSAQADLASSPPAVQPAAAAPPVVPAPPAPAPPVLAPPAPAEKAPDLSKIEEPKKDPAEPRTPRGQLSAHGLKNLKGATVFVKVEAGRLSGSGSGFLVNLDGQTGYIITNHHVVNPEAELLQPVRGPRGTTGLRIVKYKPANARVSVVFNSGTK